MNWRTSVMRVYGKDVAPEVIWSDHHDKQHPNHLGQLWMALSVTDSILEATRVHPVTATPGEALAVHPNDATDEICVSRFCEGDCSPALPTVLKPPHTAMHSSRIGECWAEENMACPPMRQVRPHVQQFPPGKGGRSGVRDQHWP